MPAGFRKACNVDEVRNAFVGRAEKPSPEEISAALGPSAGLWNEFVSWMANTLDVTTQEWKGVCVRKYGWSLKLKHKSRTIVHMGPCIGCFRVGFALRDEALAAARAAQLPKTVRQALSQAPRYPEGSVLRWVVTKPADLDVVRKLAEIKLAH